MSIYSELYWLTRLDNIQALFLSIICVSALAPIAILFWAEAHTDNDNYSGEKLEGRREKRIRAKSNIKWFVFGLILFSILRTLTPSKDEVVFILAGGKTVEFIKQDTSINKIPSQTTAIISKFLDEQLNNLEKETKEK